MDILVIHSLYIPYIFPRYVPCIFLCVFLNLWSQEKTSPYRRTTFLFYFFRLYIFYLANLWSFNKIMCFTKQIHVFFRHCWFNKLRNTQGKIHGTYLGNIYGIYKECITNISIDIYDITINIHKYIHQTHRPNGATAPLGRRRRQRLCV